MASDDILPVSTPVRSLSLHISCIISANTRSINSRIKKEMLPKMMVAGEDITPDNE